MTQERGSAHVLATAMVMMVTMAMVSHCEAATYTLGNTVWVINGGKAIANWLKGKNFKAGDTIVFQYSSSAHNVAKVAPSDYNKCQPGGATVHTTGNDRIVLTNGDNYFICAKPGHCAAGMKMKVNAQ